MRFELTSYWSTATHYKHYIEDSTVSYTEKLLSQLTGSTWIQWNERHNNYKLTVNSFRLIFSLVTSFSLVQLDRLQFVQFESPWATKVGESLGDQRALWHLLILLQTGTRFQGSFVLNSHLVIFLFKWIRLLIFNIWWNYYSFEEIHDEEIKHYFMQKINYLIILALKVFAFCA